MSSRLEFTHGGHRYKLDGRPVKSVTTLLQVLAKPQLVAWKRRGKGDVSDAYAIIPLRHLARLMGDEQ